MDGVRAVLFDLDGVLVKSEEAWFLTVEAAGVRFRGRAVTREEFAPTFGQGTVADTRVFGLGCTPLELDRFYEDEFPRFLSTVWVNPDAEPVLRTLAAHGLGRALVTNSVSKVAHALLVHGGLRGALPVLATSDRVARAKPAPDLVLLACRELGVEPAQAVMVGDSRFDRDAARAAGARFVGLGTGGDVRLEALGELPGVLGLPSDARVR